MLLANHCKNALIPGRYAAGPKVVRVEIMALKPYIKIRNKGKEDRMIYTALQVITNVLGTLGVAWVGYVTLF